MTISNGDEAVPNPLALCILNSVLSSLVAHGSILAMLSIGKLSSFHQLFLDFHNFQFEKSLKSF